MRAWPILLLTAATLSGCSGLVTVDGAGSDAEGEPFEAVAAPAWQPGYRFRYETDGDVSFEYQADGPDGHEGGSEGQSWEGEPGLDYTVLNTQETVDGEAAYLARATSEYDETLVAILADDLSIRFLGYGAFGCTPVGCHGDEGMGTDSGLRFPLVHGDTWQDTVSAGDGPGLAPMRIDTKVLGVKSVQGPDGPVDAVHVRHLATGDIDALRRMMVQEAGEEGEEVEDIEVEGRIEGRRDVYYAPSLRNVVLDATESVGHVRVSFVEDGQRMSFASDFTVHHANRLVEASFDVTEQVPLADLLAQTPTPPTWPEAQVVRPLLLSIEPAVVNVAEAHEIDVVADAGGLRVEVTMTDADGFVVPEGPNGHPWLWDDPHATYVLDQPGAYLVTAVARDDYGRVVQVRKAVLEATYQTVFDADCPLVAPGTPCDVLEFPVGPGSGPVSAIAYVADPLPVDTPGDLVLSWPNNRAIGPRTGDVAHVSADASGEDAAYWTLAYEPQAGVGQRAMYEVLVLPDPRLVDAMRAEAAQADGAPGTSWAPLPPPTVLDAFARLVA